MNAKQLRALAVRLAERNAAPSLVGYSLADGLFAAADLLDGRDGPYVHPDAAAHSQDAWCRRVSLRALSEGGD